MYTFLLDMLLWFFKMYIRCFSSVEMDYHCIYKLSTYFVDDLLSDLCSRGVRLLNFLWSYLRLSSVKQDGVLEIFWKNTHQTTLIPGLT